jgi:hypothetical protein
MNNLNYFINSNIIHTIKFFSLSMFSSIIIKTKSFLSQTSNESSIKFFSSFSKRIFSHLVSLFVTIYLKKEFRFRRLKKIRSEKQIILPVNNLCQNILYLYLIFINQHKFNSSFTKFRIIFYSFKNQTKSKFTNKNDY